VEAVALETPPCFFPEHVQAAVDTRWKLALEMENFNASKAPEPAKR